MNLNKRPIISEQWINSVQPTLDGFLNCEIELLDMKTEEDWNAGYDWKANTGTAVPDVLWSGAAQIQVYRFTLTVDAPVGSVDQTRTVRFTMPMADIAGIHIRKGQRIRVTSCDNDPEVMTYQYNVVSGLNSGAGFRRTIECEVDMARVVE